VVDNILVHWICAVSDALLWVTKK